MKRHLFAVTLAALLAVSSGAAIADQQPATQTMQLPPMTPGQMVMNCVISGALLSAIGGLGILAPNTLSLATKTSFALMHEAIYGCGLGVIGGYASQSLLSLVPLPPPPPQNSPSLTSLPNFPKFPESPESPESLTPSNIAPAPESPDPSNVAPAPAVAAPWR